MVKVTIVPAETVETGEDPEVNASEVVVLTRACASALTEAPITSAKAKDTEVSFME